MKNLRQNAKRILTDAGGYGLIVLGVALGWVPGPGGIPLILAGLGLLSINNEWARRVRNHLLRHGSRITQILFPPNPVLQWLYDAIVVLLLVLVGILEWQHAAVWQISLGVGLFFVALLIAALNRDRYARLRGKPTR